MDTKTKSRKPIPNLFADGIELKTDQEKANALMAQFASVYSNDNNYNPHFPQVLPEESLDDIDFSEHRDGNGFF